MPKFLAIFILLSTSLVKASVSLDQLKTGDIILQPLNCWSCWLIEEQERSDFSHMGIIFRIENKISIIEALGVVREISLEDFLKRNRKNKRAKILRSFEVFDSNKLLIDAKSVLGNPYDKMFLWNNFQGKKESLYCSELVYKLFKKQITFTDLTPKIMKYDINPKAWDQYFNGNTPRGLLGISPEDFNLSSDFYVIGEL